MLRLTLILALLAPVSAQAAGPVDPDWPCIQRRQPALSVGQLWSGPPMDAAAEALAQAPEIRELAEIIALRRTELAEAETLIAEFAASHDAAALPALFLAVFDRIQDRRNRVMAGITRYAHKQEALDREINDLRHRMDALTAADPPDFDAIDKVEIDLDWATRIFQDRQQSLTYVCEVPVLLERRAFALGRAIAGHLPK
ncbi:MAG: hypothetical protein R3D63_09610 [Paracoccaceae bacterium]